MEDFDNDVLVGVKASSDEKFDIISDEIDFLEIVDGHTLSRPLIKLVVQNDGSNADVLRVESSRASSLDATITVLEDV